MKDINKLINLKIPLVLASKSPRRKKLLEMLGFEFIIFESEIDEKSYPLDTDPGEYTGQLALMKAEEVAGKLDYDAIVIGADTIVVIDNEILNKPANEAEAEIMLKKLSGRTHIVYTGLAIVESSSRRYLSAVKETKVTFRELQNNEISAYIETGSPMDKAGAYGIQDDFGAVFINHIEGCYYNIVGLPIELMYEKLRDFVNEK